MIYVVIDTNVIVSALITHQSSAATVGVMERLFEGEITPVYNDEMLNEYDEVLHRPKFRLSDADVRAVIDYVRRFGIEVCRLPYTGVMPDEKDRPFYEVSLSQEKSFLVTGNLKHFPATPQVVSPTELLRILEDERR